MMKALYTAATGMKGQQMTVDVISNNIANVNTSGFKKSRVNFQDLLYVRLQKPGDAALAIQSPTGLEIGSGVRAVSTTRVFTPGVLEGTQRELDVAIQGNGFFAVQLPDGSLGYTREGSLHVDSQLNLVTSQGYRLDPQITFPQNVLNVTIGPDGLITAATSDNPDVAQQVGQLQLTMFTNASGLEAIGGNIYRPSPASGPPTEVIPGSEGSGTMVQAFLERSNVDTVSELVNLIVAQRAYEVNSRAIRSGDEMLSQVNNLIR
jgi:flagellar basal-body rod protein FlgG